MRLKRAGFAVLAAFVVACAVPIGHAQDKVLNLYTARHYQTDEALYSNFTRLTGIKVNRIEGQEEPLMERIRNEGANSPADVFLTVDAGRLWRADQAGLFAPVRSQLLETRIPANYRDPDGHWFGFSLRARIITYDKLAFKAGAITRYEDLADPKYKGTICIRSGAYVYNLSLLASIIGADGEQKAEEWAKGVKANLARDPKGGDTDQLKGVAAGECKIAVNNSYYYVRLMRSNRAEDRQIAESLGVVWPNQADRGAHVNVSGGGMLKHAPNKDAAVKFLEYLASDEAQIYFANGNNEWPAVPTVAIDNPELKALGRFKPDPINVALLGKNQPLAQKILDRVGFK